MRIPVRGCAGCGERRWRDCAGILEREHCADGSRPCGLAPQHPRATMQKHEKKRVAGGACCNCLKIKGQISGLYLSRKEVVQSQLWTLLHGRNSSTSWPLLWCLQCP